MRDYDSPPNPSSRVAWCVAGVGGLLLLAWAFGGFDVGGPETGTLSDDPVAAHLDGIDLEPFPNLPEQFEPGEPEVVTAQVANGPDPWGTDIPAAADDDGTDIPEPTGVPELPNDPGFAELPDSIPPEFAANEPEYEDVHPLATPVRTASLDQHPFELVRAESPVIEPRGAEGAMLDLDQIDTMLRANRTADAHAALSRIWAEHPRARPTIATRIERTASAIFFDPEQHFMEPYTVRSGDTLRRIGQRYDLPWQYVVRLNRVDPRTIRPGNLLKVVRGPFHAHVDLSEFTLTILNHGHYVRHYPIAVGRDIVGRSGKFEVREKVTNPRYVDPRGRVVAADDPTNPLGEHLVSLGNGCGIHGTTNPESVGHVTPVGCISLRNADAAEVFDLLVPGSEVVVAQ